MKWTFLLSRIREEFPEIKWKNHRFLTHGWDHFVIILDEEIVFRTPKDSRYKNEFENEIRLLHYLKSRLNVGIPQYKYFSKDRSFAGYNMLRGLELTASHFHRMNALEKETVARQLAEFLTALHTTPKSAIKRFHVKLENQQKSYHELVRSIRKLVFPRLPKKDTQLIEQYFEELRTALSNDFPKVLVHSDLTGEHILWDANSRQINIIDFSDRAFGDPAGDFADFLEYSLKFTKHIFNLYKGQKDAHMLDRSRLYFKRIPLYMMKDSLQGFPCTFKQGYEMFKKRFRT